MAPKFKEHGLPCPNPLCESHDAFAIDQKGWGRCFSCNKVYRPNEFIYDEISGQYQEFTGDLMEHPEKITEGEVTYVYRNERGLSKSTMEFYDIAIKQIDGVDDVYGFVYPNQSVKTKKVDRNVPRKDRYKWLGSSQNAGLFGKDKFDPGSKKAVYVTEGEFDAPSIWEALGGSVAATSVQSSSTALRDVTVDRDYLNSFDKIILALDNDEPGKEATRKIVCSGLFDFNKLYIVEFQKYKDANDYAQHGEMKELASVAKKYKKYTPDNIISAFSEIEEALKQGDDEIIGTYPTEKLNEMLYGFTRGTVVLVKGMEGIGKQLPNTTKIPTPTGFKLMGDLVVGDEIFGADGKITKVSYITDTQFGVPCYELVFADGTRQVAGGPHKWGVYDTYGKYHVKTTEEILNEGVTRGEVALYSVPITQPIDLPDADLEIDPYLLGYWLGDGHSYSANITVGVADIDQFEESIDGQYTFKSKQKTAYQYRVKGLTHKMLVRGNLLKNKHIPREYLRASIQQRQRLLAGLMDSDGSVTSVGCEYYSSNERLVNDFLELVRGLGYKARVRPKMAMLNGKEYGLTWTVWFLAHGNRPIFTFKRKQEKVVYCKTRRATHKTIREIIPVESVPSRCLQVDNDSHLFLCGEHFTVTHNTEILRWMEYHLLKTTNLRLGLIHMEEDKATTIKGVATYELDAPCNLPDFGITDAEIMDGYKKAVGGDESRVYIYTMFGGDDPDDVLDSIRFLVSSGGVDVVFLDHITLLVTGVEEGDERRKLDYLSTKLMKMAKELKFCLVMISHVNDDGETRGSRNIKKVAYTSLSLYRDLMSDNEYEKNCLRLEIDKNRKTGRTGKAGILHFNPETTKLEEV